MKTPIVDFVKAYIEADVSRLHMPGHKGKSYLGCEALDITEIGGADVLYSADGIINESEENASSLFRTAHTFYSTEGSSLAIKAMLSIIAKKGDHILATRNAHKSLIYACALLDIDVEWIYPDEYTHLCSCNVTSQTVYEALDKAQKMPAAVYLTSPDYLGNILDITGISKVCDSFGVPVIVDNAHGAYLAFCNPSMHPIALGATMCCDSAHKTLPALTGGAYLHISSKADKRYTEIARARLSVFASTSPSYLILQSLDICNRVLADGYKELLDTTVRRVDRLKSELAGLGFSIYKSEPLKIVIETKKAGYRGTELAELLRKDKLEFEFCDDDYIVAMITPDTREIDFDRLLCAMSKIEIKAPIADIPIYPKKAKKVISLRDAIFCENETVDLSSALGRICASPTVACPPAVPVVMSGELVGESEIALLKRYGIEKIDVVK